MSGVLRSFQQYFTNYLGRFHYLHIEIPVTGIDADGKEKALS